MSYFEECGQNKGFNSSILGAVCDEGGINLSSRDQNVDAEALVQQATSLIEKKLYFEALSKLEHGLVVDPANTRVWEELVVCNLELGKPKKAIDALNNLLKLEPNSSSKWGDKGLIHLLLNENPEGIEAIRESLRIKPRDVHKWELLATALIAEERWDDAVDALEKSLDLNPNSAVTWYNLAVCYLYYEDFSSALEAVEYAIAIQPSLEDIAAPWVDLLYDESLEETYPTISGIVAS
jgi:tetratricopeptide (TPR) repeat protein